ncbi:hypothetical protein B0H13DRAFT_1909955 [Mycena leptocephala]|nr:hypothetical protein B0H13DRAFT_1909955 [Mycena leptocephala]
MVPFQVYEFLYCGAENEISAFACCSIAAVEVSRVWSRKFSGATVLYACLRYGTLFEKITVLFLASWYLSPHQELLDSDNSFALIRLQYVYAHQEASAVDRYGCQMAYLASATVHDRQTFLLEIHKTRIDFSAVRIGGIIADVLSETIVIFVTVRRTFWLRNAFEGKKHPGLAMIMLRDADMLVLIFDHVPEFATRYDYWVVPYYTPVYVPPLHFKASAPRLSLARSFRTIIICRFLLMLRAVYYDEGADSDGTAMDQSIHFASRVIGPMGAPVDGSRFDEDSDIEDEESVYAEDPLVAGLMMMSAAPKAAKDDMVTLQDLSHRSLSNGSGTQVEGEVV